MSKEASGEADSPGSASSRWNEESGLGVRRQSSGALASVEKVVRVSKAQFTILGACGAMPRQAFRVVSFRRFLARPPKDRFRSSLVRLVETTWHSEPRAP